jgi:hypothetical protein
LASAVPAVRPDSEARNRLFMTGSQSLYAVFVETRGAHLT